MTVQIQLQSPSLEALVRHIRATGVTLTKMIGNGMDVGLRE
jgi:hypothetical protein